VIADPPSVAEAVKFTVACPSPAVATPITGAEAGAGASEALGVTLLVAVETVLKPAAFLDVTVKVYAVPLVKPSIAIGELKPAAVMPSGEEVTV
jgi:hypothetical protein